MIIDAMERENLELREEEMTAKPDVRIGAVAVAAGSTPFQTTAR